MLYASPAALKTLAAKGWNYSQVDSALNYPITRIKLPFLNVRTRKSQVTPMLVVTVNPPVQHVDKSMIKKFK